MGGWWRGGERVSSSTLYRGSGEAAGVRETPSLSPATVAGVVSVSVRV